MKLIKLVSWFKPL